LRELTCLNDNEVGTLRASTCFGAACRKTFGQLNVADLHATIGHFYQTILY
jgi:hypothetical protein